MEISRRVPNGGKKSCILVNVKTILLLLGDSERIQYGDSFFFRILHILRQQPRSVFLVKLIPYIMLIL